LELYSLALFFDENGDVQTSTYDLQDEAVARRWAAEAAQKKPWRPELWGLFAALLLREETSPLRILELGAGPGLLAARILRDVPVSEYVLFDFSEPMIRMAREALGTREDVSFHLGNFKAPAWPRRVPGLFDAVISMQAVHEIRHKRHVPWLYAQAATLLRPKGVLIICDAEPTPDQSEEQRQLASTRREQVHAMLWAGFEQVACHHFEHQYYVISARKEVSRDGLEAPFEQLDELLVTLGASAR
jgi:SAM-dependent methyltransferase